MDLGTLASTIQTFFNQTANSVARTTGFVTRTSKLTGAVFLQTFTFGFLDTPDASLTGLVETSHDLGVTITKQGLQTRLEEAIPFLKEMFQRAFALFHHTLRLDLEILRQFTAIYLTDSTTVALPQQLQTEFPGCGGSGPVAALKLQLTFEFLQGVMTALTFQTGRTPDQIYTDDLHNLVTGALYLTDLGYFVLARFRAIAAGQAYFLSRYDTKTALFDAPMETPLDLLEWLRQHPESLFEQSVQIGQHERLPCRMVAVRVPQEVADRRRYKAREAARRKRHTPSERHLELLNWSVFITNVPASMLTSSQVVLLYSVRWQIELIFKMWKSNCAVARVAGRRRERVLSELYAKLIGMVVMQFLLAPYRDREREVSAVKVMRLIQHHVKQVIESIGTLEQLTTTLQNLVVRFLTNGLKDKRQKRLTTYQELRRLKIGLA
jgi:hypothetical protein